MLRVVADLEVECYPPQQRLMLGEELPVAALILQTFAVWEQSAASVSCSKEQKLQAGLLLAIHWKQK
ncbi:hypothetical protein GW7_10460 [Heterocephalus glaber]|uniref:Uncharacterized protein n=1 Tax=Heterocephalus glaber TaxID=10181 RepID=G5B1P7_HETGA|nr:hypothetical protein GW7_10460 [Heterocephalus glaber]